jgi:WD40 repeat protein
MVETTESTPARKNASVMISYSRKDLAFVRTLFEGLLAEGFAKEDIWVDWEGIPLTADWMAEITEGIQSANAFIFVISPDSVASEVCAKELAIAAESNKRFVPILYREPGKGAALHPKISSHNWVFMREEQELEKNLPPLVEALNTDLDWLAQHTRLFNRALEWERKDHNDSYLVRGTDLQEAQSFIELGAAGKEPAPTTLHVEYVQAARKHAAVIRRRNRIIAAVVGVALFLLSVFALVQWAVAEQEKVRADNSANTAVANEQIAHTQEAIAIDAQAQAEKEARVANAQALAAEALNQKDNDSQLALMLALLSIQETRADGVVLSESKSALFASLNSPNVLYTFPKSDALIRSVAYDPNGVYGASGDANGKVMIWDLESRKPLHEPIEMGNDNSINGMDFSPDGTRLGIAIEDGTAKVLDVASGQTIFTLQGHTGAVNDIDFSPDGKLIATGGEDATIKFWFADQGTLRVTLFDHQGEVRAVEFGPDSSLLISGSLDDTAILWNVTDDGVDLLRILRPDGLNGNGHVESVAFNPFGDRILTGGNQTTIVWSTFEDKELHRLRGNRAEVYEVAFAPDGLSMLTASSGIKIWDYFYGIERYNLSSHRGEVTSASFSPDGTFILTGSWDNTVKLWAANLLIETLKLKENISRKLDAQYSSDGRWIATADDNGNVLLYDAQTGQVVDQRVVDEAVSTVSFDPQNSGRFITGDDLGQVIVWMAGSDEPALTISAHKDGVASAVFSPDSRKILSSGGDSAAKVWDAESGTELAVLMHDFGSVFQARFSKDGSRIVTAGQDNTARIWDASNGQQLMQLKGHTDYVLTAVFSHDGKYVYTGSFDNTIKKWDVQTGQLVQTLAGHTGKVNDLDINRDDTLLVSGSTDTTVKIWDLKTGREIFNYLGNNEDTNSVAFNLDGSKVLTASSDETTKEFTINYEDLLKIAQQYELRSLTPEECESFLNRADCSLHLFEGNQTTSTLPATPTLESVTVSTPTELSAQATPTPAAADTPTAESQISPANESFYTEEFDGSIDSWKMFMASGLESQVADSVDNGALAVQLSPHEDKVPWVHFINDAFSYADVRVDAIVTNNGNNANGVSLVCRNSEAGWYEFWVSNAQLYAIYAYDSLGAVQPGYFEIAAGGSPAITAGHTTNVYTAICRGNELTLLVNDTVVNTVTDIRYNFTEGKIGVAVSSLQLLPVDVQIESVTVSAP